MERWKSRKGKDQIQMSYRCSAEMCAYEYIKFTCPPSPWFLEENDGIGGGEHIYIYM